MAKFTKEVDGKKVTIEEDREFLYNVLEREGFTKVEDKKSKEKEEE